MARRRKQARQPSRKHPAETGDEKRAANELRIIGGTFRGRKLLYSGRFETRPMKDRVREAMFNLVGPAVRGRHAIDLFAGTGALGLEALSRGAVSATFIERHIPTARVIMQNIDLLGVQDFTHVETADTFAWIKLQPELPADPWLVFCSPPWDLFVDQQADMLSLLGRLVEMAPAESIFVVESDARFDCGQLPQPDRWRVREYPPARIGILRLTEELTEH